MNIPTELDWVTERAKCSPETVFHLLETQAKADAEKRTLLRSAAELDGGIEFSFVPGSDAFKIAVQCAGEIVGWATFGKVSEGIQVRYKDGTSFIGMLTLGNDGRCRLKIGESEGLEFWQFRKKALEPIFFDLIRRLRQ